MTIDASVEIRTTPVESWGKLLNKGTLRLWLRRVKRPYDFRTSGVVFDYFLQCLREDIIPATITNNDQKV